MAAESIRRPLLFPGSVADPAPIAINPATMPHCPNSDADRPNVSAHSADANTNAHGANVNSDCRPPRPDASSMIDADAANQRAGLGWNK